MVINGLIKMLAVVGALCLGGVFCFLGYALFTFVRDKIDDLIWTYQYKHRFDKPPTAKCYCNDCEYHAKDLKCNNVTWADRYTPDNGFCYAANPRKRIVKNALK